MPHDTVPTSGESLWIRDRGPDPRWTPLDGDATADVVVVGAGIAGLTAADALARGGLGVRVFESRLLGSGATGFTTAKISLLQGAIYHALTERHGSSVARAYAVANREGADHLLARLEELGLTDTVTTRDAASYASAPADATMVRDEAAAAAAAGLAVALEDQLPELPYPVAAAVRLRDQAQFDPLPFLRGLAAAVHQAGGHVHERTRVEAIRRSGSGFLAEKPQGRVTCRHVLVCTGMPMVDRGFHFARLEPTRSYCVALRLGDGPPPDLPMVISVDDPTRSLRTSPDPAGGPDLLLVGGEGHTVGREPDTVGRYERLVGWAERHFSVAEVGWRWSTQDYRSVDLLPFVGGGGLLPDGLAVATGFGKWGMTNGAAAGLALAGGVMGAPPHWSTVYDAGRSGLRHGAGDLLKLNAEVAWHQVADRIASLAPGTPPGEGEGSVSRLGGRGTACVHGARHTVSAVCSHLGGVVAWNPAERSWDCPLHGSRFDCDGVVLQGPAVTDLARHEDRSGED